MPYAVVLQAVEPDELLEDSRVPSTITIAVLPEMDMMGFNEVEVEAASRKDLEQFVYDHWCGPGGDEDWFAWVKAKEIRELPPVPTCEKCKRADNGAEGRRIENGICDDCDARA